LILRRFHRSNTIPLFYCDYYGVDSHLIEQNATAQLDIKTAPEASCAIKVTLPSGSQSSAKGLETKIADNSGVITWSWKINWNTTPGTANINITCSKDGQSFSKSLQMEIIER